MADEYDKGFDNIDEEAPEEGKPQKAGIAAGAILGILKWVAIGLGFVFLVVVIVIITVGILNKQSKPLTELPNSEIYMKAAPMWSTFTAIDQVTVTTMDKEPWAITVKINLAYDEADKTILTELTNRKYQIQDFLRNFFSKKLIEELMPDKEPVLKEELRNQLNALLTKPAIKDIYFQDFRRTQM
ncbi:MAG TPA: flagellar basal body-associated FliL family protein [Spirochaetia bacterium]|nr:flagellar basal body-associated FliL family protein [Spirochaetales bacterium]HPD79686.1 flagellar basal body-associated FliL family protein [Spirochaetales bacterium]HQK33314.1 flagellar basal body-associated FliL family protein [Spirochaetales bacterium]HRS65114.1 flagellar basal body-associated FliL family protein [Spirochaetia bacterium]HRV27429.1 flagellar basal body-associated FliL family protein [Spirochaetia bacterium]